MKTPSVIEALEHPRLFQPWFQGPSWKNWKTILKATTALPMTSDEIAFFRTVAQRDPPKKPVREAYYIVARRGGKDSIASALTGHAAAFFNQNGKLRRGERPLCVCLGCDREQSKIVLGYTRSYFQDIPHFAKMVSRNTQTGFELTNSVDVAVATNSFRSIRGRPVLLAVLDELAFYRDEASASPDTELYNALLPATATLAGSMIIGISSPHKKSGLLYNKYRDHFGRDSDDVLVIQAPSLTLNPTLDPAIIEQALRDDPEAARAEWLAEFREDISGLVSSEALAACIDKARSGDLPPTPGDKYNAFIDGASGTIGGDSFTCGISFLRWDDRPVLAALREFRPPFVVQTIVNEIAALCRSYRINRIVGDAWSGDFIRQAFNSCGLEYQVSRRSKSQLYFEAIPLIASGRALMPANDRMISQIMNLERRVTRSSNREQISHPVGAGQHDDLSNSALASLVLASERSGGHTWGAIGAPPLHPPGGFEVPLWLS